MPWAADDGKRGSNGGRENDKEEEVGGSNEGTEVEDKQEH